LIARHNLWKDLVSGSLQDFNRPVISKRALQYDCVGYTM